MKHISHPCLSNYTWSLLPPSSSCFINSRCCWLSPCLEFERLHVSCKQSDTRYSCYENEVIYKHACTDNSLPSHMHSPLHTLCHWKMGLTPTSCQGEREPRLKSTSPSPCQMWRRKKRLLTRRKYSNSSTRTASVSRETQHQTRKMQW